MPGVFVRRYQRFLAEVRLADGRLVTAHCPNSGSMKGCTIPDSEVRLSAAAHSKRRTRYTWELIRLPSTWVGINTLTANTGISRCLTRGIVLAFNKLRRRCASLALSTPFFCTLMEAVPSGARHTLSQLGESWIALQPCLSRIGARRGRNSTDTSLNACSSGL
ncbi:MAG: hypothetical protein ACLFVT_08945 [Syntrophobacteria bacterium]